MMKHPRMTKVFEERNTKQSQQLMEIRPKELENVSDWYAWSLYWNIVPLHVEKLHTLVKDLDDKLDEKEAIVSRSNLIDWVIEYRDRRQALLFCVDFMLGLTNEETQRQLSRSVTEWEECFVKMELSWGYWFPDVKQILKCPIDGTTALKQSQVANRTSTDAAMRCPRTRKLRQSRVHQAKQSDKQSTPTAAFVLPTPSLLDDPHDLPKLLLDEAATYTSLDIVLGSATFDFFELPTELVLLPVSSTLET